MSFPRLNDWLQSYATVCATEPTRYAVGLSPRSVCDVFVGCGSPMDHILRGHVDPYLGMTYPCCPIYNHATSLIARVLFRCRPV